MSFWTSFKAYVQIKSVIFALLKSWNKGLASIMFNLGTQKEKKKLKAICHNWLLSQFKGKGYSDSKVKGIISTSMLTIEKQLFFWHKL